MQHDVRPQVRDRVKRGAAIADVDPQIAEQQLGHARALIERPRGWFEG